MNRIVIIRMVRKERANKMKEYFFAIVLLFGSLGANAQKNAQWSTQKANAWYERQDWLVGANFVPSTSINQLEMWQKETFDLPTIDRELAWAEDIGMNAMRVYLHDLVWKADAKGFKERGTHSDVGFVQRARQQRL